MKTAEEIISYLEAELADACELYDASKGKDAQQAYAALLKVVTIEQILADIK